MSETAEMPIMDNECPFRHELNPYNNLGDSTARTNYFIFQAGMKAGFREAEEELTKLRAFVKDTKIMAEFYAARWERIYTPDGVMVRPADSTGAFEDRFERAREFLFKHSELIKGEA
jgi:hypothetical protein